MYNFKESEPEILEFWKKQKIYEKRKEKNKKGKKYYFLQGPPYTSGRLHIGHAWNNSMKDIILRYKRMKGMNVWDRAGYDMHGLPTENAAMKKLGLKNKEEIEKFGIAKFTEECVNLAVSNAKLMDADLQRLAVWLDYSDPYYPVKNEFMESEWWLMKRAYDQKRLYKGKKIMPWCVNCETALAKHELEYDNVKENSIFLKFQLKDEKNKFLIIWTTTPWTIPFNLAVMVNPKIEYAEVKAGKETWIVAKDLIEKVAKATGEKLSIIETVQGKNLEGLRYIHPLHDELRKQFDAINCKNMHSIILSEQYVTTEDGSGLVHCAPGCGPEDFEVGQEYGLPAFNHLNEKGIFEDMGEFSGFQAKKDDYKFVNALKEKNSLIAEQKIEHEYATCWRCHNPIVFRATEQWFMKIEDLIKGMLKANNKVNWVPKWGKEAFDAWVNVLKDNSITRQRYWGTPVPVWECESCKHIEVIGSVDELKKKATTKIPADLHRPAIDSVLLKCDKCAGQMKRVEDVIDVWIDAGTLSWNCLYYPGREDLFRELYPAELILEGTEQVKLWFSMLLICSMVAFKKPCYKNVYMHGMILDYQGTKMSKSLGNIISPYEVVDKYGSDVLRYYMCEIPAGENISFSWENIKVKQRNLVVFWNLAEYLLNLSDKIPRKAGLDIEEKYILSRLNSTIKKTTELLENYKLDEVITELEKFYLEISRGYIQMIREKASKKGKLAVAYTLNKCLAELLKMFSIVCPCISEAAYLRLREKFKLKEESIHLYDWPKASEKLIDAKLETEMKNVQELLTVILAEREKVKIGLRWPLASAVAVSKNAIRKELVELLEKQANIKKINLRIGDVFDVNLNTQMTPELEAEGYTRELSRKIQAMRKNAGLKKEDKIKLTISADSELIEMLKTQEKSLQEKVNAGKFELTAEEAKIKIYKNNAEEKIKEKTVKIGFDVL
jgi:isoleucyl-tRNA synthetase